MCPDVLQFLSYVAGRTRQVQLGTMVVVLPWHNPLRVAEQVSMLDNLSDGRVILGVGRGLARIEHQGFGLDMSETRTRFVESAECLLTSLEKGYCEFEGEFIKQPRRDIRPEPLRSFKGRTYAAAISPESSRIMAELGIGLLIIPQKPWPEVASDLDNYREVYRQVNSAEPPSPVVSAWVFCDEDEDRARHMARQYIGGYWKSLISHYEFRSDHLKRTRGYEYYGNVTDKLDKYGDDIVMDFFMDLQVYGTPDQCLEKIMDIQRKTGNEHFVGVFSYAGMPYEETERNIRLFADKVMPRLQETVSATPEQGQ